MIDNRQRSEEFAEAIPLVCNCTKLRRAARRISRFYDDYLAEIGLKTNQYSILASLAHFGPKTMQQLADQMAMDRATMGHNIKPLERDGFVAITTNPDDRRSKILSITPKGSETIECGRPLWMEAQKEFEHRFGAENAVLLRAMTDTIAESFRDSARAD